MGGFFTRIRYKMQMWMQGRYGVDDLFKLLIGIAFVFMFLAYIPFLWYMHFGFLIFAFWAYFRCFSRNIGARRKELYKYTSIKTKVKNSISLRKKIWRERKTHKYFKCKKCRAVLRVPKGKGKIEVTCRVCREKQIKKS